MEKRVLLAIFLCFLSLYLWQTFVVKPVPKPSAAGPGAPAPRGTSGPTQAPATTPPPNATPQAEAVPPPPAAAVVTGETQEKTVRIETKDVIALFTNRGARLKSWRVKHYLDHGRQPQELVLDLPNEPLPFTLRTSDEPTNMAMNGALFAVQGGSAAAGVEPAGAPLEVKFEYADAAGLHVTKEFRLEPAGYVVSVGATVARADDSPVPFSIVWGPAVGDITENSQYAKKAGALLFQDGKARRPAPKEIAAQPTADGDFRYAGVEDNYFMTVALFLGPSNVTFRPVTIPPPPNSKDPARELVAYSVERRSADQPTKFFVGPKDFDVLASIHPDVVKAIDFGIFAVLVVPLLRSLKWINSYVGNYGWSIIILTIIINAIMFPLRHKSNVSMRKMQEIQPEVKAIQDRYSKLKATDPAKQKMNTELMALYKERGVNPAGGCVPMLLTMPVLIALYSLLQTAIELRGAPFFGWIHDLSVHDPFYITPIVMGGTMVWQQRLAPAGADPTQQKMMMFMPIIFTVMFLWMPAGVALYWFIGNLLGIGQQYLTNYLIGPPNVRTVRPAAERRVKRVGSGKTEAANSKP